MADWIERVECRGYPTELFLVSQRGRPMPGVRELLCGVCLVSGPCLADGWWDEMSVRGGMSPIQRRNLTLYLAARSSTARQVEAV